MRVSADLRRQRKGTMRDPTVRSPSNPQEEDMVPHPISHMLKNENGKQSTGTTLLFGGEGGNDGNHWSMMIID